MSRKPASRRRPARKPTSMERSIVLDCVKRINEAETALKSEAKGDDYKAIRAAIEQLDHATRRFAELMMDSAVSGAIGGKTMQAAGETIGEAPSAPHPFAKAQVLSPDQEAEEIENSVKQEATAGESTED